MVLARVRTRPQKQSPRVALREPAHQPKAKAVTRGPVHEVQARTRRRKNVESEDQFYLPMDEIPEDSTYEWKRLSVMGLEDPFYIARQREQGWEPVMSSRHANWLPPGYDKPHIIKGGLILMERPKELTQEARREERAMSKKQVREAEARLGMTPRGEMTRNFPGINVGVQKEMMRPVAIQGED